MSRPIPLKLPPGWLRDTLEEASRGVKNWSPMMKKANAEKLRAAKAPDGCAPDNAAEALADAWASMDGKLDDFRAGKHAGSLDDEPGGHYSGYLCEAQEMLKRLERRGYRIAEITGG